MAQPQHRWFPRPPDFDRRGLLTDLTAGLTLAVIMVPQAMAYGLLAGVPPVYGLYAALVPLLIYGLLASTPHVNVGPTALASLLCLSGLSGLAEPGTERYIEYAVALAGLTGVLQLLFGVLRLGALVSLLSRPVISGFVSAAAILIVASQLKSLFGIDVGRADNFLETVQLFFGRLGTADGLTMLLSGLTLLVLVLGSWLAPKFPTMLVWIVAATIGVAALRLDERGIMVVGELPAGVPSFALPQLSGGILLELLPIALVLALISFVETLSIGKSFAPRYGYYRVRPNRELVALGLSKVVGSFFRAIPTSASFSRSAVLEGGGARTAAAGGVAFVLLLLVLLFFTPAFYYLPIPVLAAIIVYSVHKLFDWREAQRLLKLAPKEFATLTITFLFTLLFGLQIGIAGGVVLSIVFVLLRASRPHLAELGRVPGTNAFRNVARFTDAEVDPTLLLARFDAELYFGNAEYFRDRLLELVDTKGTRLRAVILDAHTINDLDTSGLFALEQLHQSLAERGVELHLTGVIGPVRDILFRSGFMEKLGPDRQFLSLQDALRHLREAGAGRDWDLPAVQHRE